MSWRQGSEPPASTIPNAGTPAPSGTPPPAPPSRPPDGPPPLATWRKVVLGILFVVLVGGIIGIVAVRQSDNGDDPAEAPPPASGPAQPTTVATSPAESDQPPPLLNTGEDWTTMVRSMEAYLYWLARHPDPELLDKLAHPSDPLLAETRNALAKFASGEWRYDPNPRPTVVDSVVLTSRIFDGRQVLLLVSYGFTDRYRVVDRAGNVVQDDPATPSRKAILTLIQDPGDPHWRVAKADPV